ncbi:MAG: DUF6596 domain-containing protein, partial [Bacteroidota bacterium]
LLKRNQILQQKVLPQLASEQMLSPEINFEEEQLLTDSSLKMIFACCHPNLPTESQVALALKSLCGFSVPEVANALLTNEATINKRLYRAKKKFRDGSILFQLPEDKILHLRLNSVFTTIYLLFNEGYYSSRNEQLIRGKLCFEAIRLQKMIVEAYPKSAKGQALLALLYLQFARIESRMSSEEGIIILEAQNRSVWDKELIAMGARCLSASIQTDEVHAYQLQAGIALEHCLASSFEETNWQSIENQYKILYQLEANPIVALNQIIAQFYNGKRAIALESLLQLEQNRLLYHNPLYHTTLGKFYAALDEKTLAFEAYEMGLEFSKSPLEQKRIQKMIAEL